MAKSSKKQPNETEQPGAAMTTIIFIVGGIITAAGVFLVMTANKRPPGSADWLWWTGVVVAALGVHALFFSGMNREQIYEWVKSESFALALALMIRWPIAEPYRIPSGSMEPTLHGDARFGRGDRVFVNKWIYGVRWPFMNKRIYHGQEPKRWDIVVFKAVSAEAAHPTLIKRVVGLPGERIHIQDGKVFVNGKPLELPSFMPDVYYTSPPPNTLSGMMYGIRTEDEYALVPPDHYLVLGDNSSNSADGRYFGWVPNGNIVGRAASIWWPPTRWRDFTGFSHTWWWRIVVVLLSMLTGARLFIGRSWALSRGGSHLFVEFLSFGLRLPFTRYWLLQWGQPERGDMVLYRCASDKAPNGVVLVGRIAGRPGEKVAITDGKLLVNDAEAQGPPTLTAVNYAIVHPDAAYGRSRAKTHSQVPEGCYFILADPAFDPDDDERLDSRILGWIPREEIVGRAAAIWWPIGRMRRIK